MYMSHTWNAKYRTHNPEGSEALRFSWSHQIAPPRRSGCPRSRLHSGGLGSPGNCSQFGQADSSLSLQYLSFDPFPGRSTRTDWLQVNASLSPSLYIPMRETPT